MEDREIKDEVLEAESIIRGLAQRMKNTDAAWQTAEAVRQSLTEARAALEESSAQLDKLSAMVIDSIRRVEEATLNQTQRTESVLLTVTGEISNESQGLRDLHGKLAATAQSAAQAVQTAREKEGEILLEMRNLSARLPARMAEATANTVAVLSQEVQRAQQAGETLLAHMEQSKNEFQASLAREGEAIQEIRQDLHQMAAARENSVANLNARLQESLVRSTTQVALVESNILTQVKSANRKALGILVLQLVLMAAMTAAGVLAARFLLH
jgi:hypothetical protein